MLAVLGLGVLVASVLLASAPIYARAMADLGLDFTVRDELRDEPSIRVGIETQALGTPDTLAVREGVSQRIDERVGWFELRRSKVLESARLTLGSDGTEPRAGSPLAVLYAIEGYEAHVMLVEGRLPVPTGVDGPLEVAMSERAAALAGLAVGEAFLLIEEFDNCARIIPAGLQPQLPCDLNGIVRYSFPAVLAGVIAIEDPDASFWASGSARFVTPTPPLVDSAVVLPVIAHVDAVLGDLAARYPAQPLNISWNVFADVDRLDRGNFERARDDIRALNEDVRNFNGFATSQLTITLDAFGRSADFQQAPLTILLVEISAIALFYVVLISFAVVERQAEEIALFRARGSSNGQVVALYALEGIVLALPAILVAPFIAGGATALLGLTPVFSGISDGELLPITFQPLAFPLAALGALLSVVALTVPAFVVSRRGPAGQRRAMARPGVSVIQRYYLDVVLVGFALLALWELNERDSVYTPSSTGGVTTDPLLLMAPAIIIAATAAALARVYPLALRVIARAVGPLVGVTVAMGLWQLVRRPGPYAQLAVLLMMAVAVGTFAASYTSTTERSYEERALFETGVELRASGSDLTGLPSDPALVEAELAGLEGVDGAAAVLRVKGERATAARSGPEVKVLGISQEGGALLWWRDDFAGSSFDALVGRLDTGVILPGIPIPSGTTELVIWANPEKTRNSVTLWVRVRDATGRHQLLDFAKLDFTGWRELRRPVEISGPFQLVEPLVLVAIILTEPPNQFNTSDAAVFIDDFGAVDAQGQLTLIEGFEGIRQWDALPSGAVEVDDLALNSELPHSGSQSARLGFRRGTSGPARGIFPRDSNVPLPMLASEAFLLQNALEVGREGLLEIDGMIVPFVVRDEYERFPTLLSVDGPSVIFDRDHLLRWARMVRTGGGNLARVNEIWLGLEPGADRELLTDAFEQLGLRRFIDQAARLESIESNPLIAASGTGILTISFVAVLGLVAAALLVSLWMALQRRRVEFAVLGAIGLTRRQILRVLALEYAIVGAVGVVAGIVVGQIVGRRMLSFLDVTEAGLPVEPGFVLETEWAFVAIGAAAVGLIFAVALVAAVRFMDRSTDAQVLRTE